MNKKLANLLALLLSFIMIVSNPMSSLAQDSANQPVSEPSVRVTAPGNTSSEQSTPVTAKGNTASGQSIQITAPGNDAAYESEEDTLISVEDTLICEDETLISAADTADLEEVVGHSDRHEHGKGLIKPYVIVQPLSSDDITYVDPAEEPLVGSSEIATTLDEFAELYGKASNEAAERSCCQMGN